MPSKQKGWASLRKPSLASNTRGTVTYLTSASLSVAQARTLRASLFMSFTTSVCNRSGARVCTASNNLLA